MTKKKSFFEKLEAEIINDAGAYVKDKVTRKVIRVGEVSIAFLFAFILIIIGIAQLLEGFFPILENGLNYIVLGFLFFLIALILK